MEFKNFSTITRAYTADLNSLKSVTASLMNKNSQEMENIEEILVHLALCHAIIIDPSTKKYNSSSPDELALVEGAKILGYEFLGKDPDNIITVKTP